MKEVKGDVCFFHSQTDNKWQWFLADMYGRAVLKCTEKFNSYDEAIMDYDIHGPEAQQRIKDFKVRE